MRTRFRGTGATLHGAAASYKYSNGNVIQLPTLNYMFSEEYAVIVDDPSRRWIRTKDGPRLRYKPCRHTRHTAAVPAQGWIYSMPAPDTSQAYFTPMWQVLGNAPMHPYTGTYWDFSEHAMSFVDLSHSKSDYYDHWQSAKPGLTTRAGLSVFLFELRDLSRMFKVLPEKHFSFSDWRSVLRYANGQHLNYNFGWKPFISDLRKTFRALSTFESRLHKFITSEGKSLTRHRSTESELSVSRTQDTSDPIINYSGFWKWYYAYSGTMTSKSGFQFSYEIPKYSRNELRARALLDSLGLNVNPSTIWQVLPWSFVVDWFYNVQGLLASYEDDWITPYVYWDQSYTSSRADCTGSWWMENTRGNSLSGITWSAVIYNRSVGLTPDFSGETDSLSADKIRLGSSLILGRLL